MKIFNYHNYLHSFFKLYEFLANLKIRIFNRTNIFLLITKNDRTLNLNETKRKKVTVNKNKFALNMFCNRYG